MRSPGLIVPGSTTHLVVPSLRDPGSARAADYRARVLGMGAGLIGYWTLDELAGTTVYDQSGNGRNGAYTGVDLGQSGIGDGRTAPWLDGTNDYVNLYSASLASAFSGAEGTLLCWVKVNSLAMWTDGVSRRVASVEVDGSNRIYIHKEGGSSLFYSTYFAGGTAEQLNHGALTVTGWFCVGLTWSASADQVRHYRDGVLLGTHTALGTWAGSLASNACVLGANNTTPAAVWHGWLAHGALWNRALTPSEMAALGVA